MKLCIVYFNQRDKFEFLYLKLLTFRESRKFTYEDNLISLEH